MNIGVAILIFLNFLLQKDDIPSPDSEQMEVTNNNEISSSIASPSSTSDDRLHDSEKLRNVQELLDGVCQKFRSVFSTLSIIREDSGSGKLRVYFFIFC